MPEGYPCDMPFNFSQGFRPGVSEVQAPFMQQSMHVSQPGLSFPQAIVTYSAPVIHTIPHDNIPIYHVESVDAYD